MADYTGSKHSSENQETHSFSFNSIKVDNSQEYPHEDDDNPLFDIDFTSLDYDYPLKNNSSPCADDDKEAEELKFSFSISNSINPNTNQSSFAADNLIYKDQLLSLQVPRSLDMVRHHEVGDGSGSLQWGNVNGVKYQFPNLLKTATKLKISLFRLKKSAKVGMDLQADYGRGTDSNVQKQSKFFIVKFKMVDVPLFFRFTGDNSRGSKRDESRNWFQKKSEDSHRNIGQCKSNEGDKKKVKEIVQKYVKMIKPLYLKISQRYSEKTKHEPVQKSVVANRTIHSGISGSQRIHQKQLSFYDKLKMVYKHSWKENNSSSNVNLAVPKNCSESTIMELQNAIQGAIAHCKQSNYTEAVAANPKRNCSLAFEVSLHILMGSLFSQKGHLFSQTLLILVDIPVIALLTGPLSHERHCSFSFFLSLFSFNSASLSSSRHSSCCFCNCVSQILYA